MLMKMRMVLSFVAGIIFAAILFWSFQPSGVVAQGVPLYPGHECLRYVSSWVDRNELWHDYRLSEEAEKDGYKIRNVRVTMEGHRVSILVIQ